MKLKAILLATLLAMVTLPANAETKEEPQNIEMEIGEFSYLFGLGSPLAREQTSIYSANICDSVDTATFTVQQLIADYGEIDPLNQKSIKTVIQIANNAKGTVQQFVDNINVDEDNTGKWLDIPITISVDDAATYLLTAETTATEANEATTSSSTAFFTTYLNFNCEQTYETLLEQIPEIDPEEAQAMIDEVGGYVIACMPDTFDGAKIATTSYGTERNFILVNIGPVCQILRNLENIPLDPCADYLSTMCQENWNPCYDSIRIPQNPCTMANAAIMSSFQEKENVEEDDSPAPPGPEEGECRNAVSTASGGEWAINLMQEELEALEPVEETGFFMGVGDIQIDWGDKGEIVQHMCYDPGAITIHPDSYDGSDWSGFWGECGTDVIVGIVSGAAGGAAAGAVAGAIVGGPPGAVAGAAAGAAEGAAAGLLSGALTCVGRAIVTWWQDEGWIHCYGDPEASTTWSDPGFTSDIKDLLPTSLLTLSATATGDGYRRIPYGEVLYEGKNYQKGIDACENQLQASRNAAYAAYLDWGIQTTQGTGTISATLQLIPLGNLISPLTNVAGSDDLFLSESHGLVVGCDNPASCPLTLELSLDCKGPIATESENPGEITLLFNGGVEGIVPNEIDVPSPVGALPFVDPSDALRPITVNAASGLVPCENVSVSIGGDTPLNTNGGLLPILLRGEFESAGDNEKSNNPVGIVAPIVSSTNNQLQ
jgi:hypothetical protein